MQSIEEMTLGPLEVMNALQKVYNFQDCAEMKQDGKVNFQWYISDGKTMNGVVMRRMVPGFKDGSEKYATVKKDS